MSVTLGRTNWEQTPREYHVPETWDRYYTAPVLCDRYRVLASPASYRLRASTIDYLTGPGTKLWFCSHTMPTLWSPDTAQRITPERQKAWIPDLWTTSQTPSITKQHGRSFVTGNTDSDSSSLYSRHKPKARRRRRLHKLRTVTHTLLQQPGERQPCVTFNSHFAKLIRNRCLLFWKHWNPWVRFATGPEKKGGGGAMAFTCDFISDVYTVVGRENRPPACGQMFRPPPGRREEGAKLLVSSGWQNCFAPTPCDITICRSRKWAKGIAERAAMRRQRTPRTALWKTSCALMK